VNDVAVVGAPFLDLTFEGLERLPRAGEEIVAQRLHVSPGGTGMQAIGAARLGLTTALVAPIPTRGLGGIVREFLTAEGVSVITPEVGATSGEDEPGVPVTALLGLRDGVAMATGMGGGEPGPEDVAAARATASILSLGRLRLAPDRSILYAVTGALEVPEADAKVLASLASVRAFILNASEAATLTGRADPEDAARRLSAYGPTAIVTMGPEGVVAVRSEHASVHIPAPETETNDATGAGDLFVAAFVWADLREAPLADALAWASLYAGLSVRTPTALSGAVGLRALISEGVARELSPPPGLPPS
jgi:sugar/nucleoside kinase (ribokinase family)